MIYDFEEDGKRSDNKPGYTDFYELFCKFYDKIKIEYFDDDVEYMMPIEYYSVRNDNDDIDGLLSSEDSEDSDTE